MKSFLTAILLATTLFAGQAQIECNDSNVGSAADGSIFKLDVDADGVKDFWFYVEQDNNNGNLINAYVVGIGGHEVEVELQTADWANKLAVGNQVGNNEWNDTAHLVINGSGNFTGGFIETGFIGIRLFDNGNYHMGWVSLSVYSSPAQVTVSKSAYHTTASASIEAAQCTTTTTGIPDIEPEMVTIQQKGNGLEIALTGTALSANTELLLYNLSGQLVETTALQAGQSRLELNHLPAGTYLAAIKIEQGILARKKLFIGR